MIAVILAGGAGSRLKEITKNMPKPMLPIGGRPFLEYLIMQLKKAGIKQVVLSVGFKAGIIKDYFGNGRRWGIKISYCHEKRPLGTGGALRKASSSIKDRDFIVMNGDSILNINFDDLLSSHKRKRAEVTIALVRASDTGRYGKIKINKKGEVVEFCEKTTRSKGYINAGVYIFRREFIRSIPLKKLSLEKDVLPWCTGHGFGAFITNGFFVDIGIPRAYLAMCKTPQKIMECLRNE